MAITPNTNIRLLKCPITSDNKNQISFFKYSEPKNTQETYFKSLPYLELEECSYQRKDNTMRVPYHIDDLLEYNYVMYQNENYSNKWFYAFIVNMEYKADNLTYITIGTDVFQTWAYDVTYKQSFVERQHCFKVDDTQYNNLEPENIEFGEPIITLTSDVPELKPCFVIAYSRDPYVDGLSQTQVTRGTINGMPNGLYYFCGGETAIENKLQQINNAGFSQSIITLFTIPLCSVIGYVDSSNNTWSSLYLINNTTFGDWLDSFKATPTEISYPHFPSYCFEGYTPKNNKLYHYPFHYLGFSAPNGTQKIYRYEDLNNGFVNGNYDPSIKSKFNLISEINPNPNAYLIPFNYKHSQTQYGTPGFAPNEASVISGYPTISYITDYFNSWLAQNSGVIAVQMRQEEYNYQTDVGIAQAKNVTGAISGTLSNITHFDLGGAVQTGSDLAINQILIDKQHQNHAEYINMMNAQKEKQQLLPNSATLGSSNTALLGYNYVEKSTLTEYSIKKEFAEKIDKYFTCYGYAVNKITDINLSSRSKFNYIKTVNCNIIGNIPQLDLERLKDSFNSGITLWHDPENYLNYSVQND